MKQLALGRLKTGAMNQTEQAYRDHLEGLKTAGKVHWYKFEGLKLRLADNTFYTPDFSVMAADGVMEMHEIKGHWEDDARVKIKVAASVRTMDRANAYGPAQRVQSLGCLV